MLSIGTGTITERVRPLWPSTVERALALRPTNGTKGPTRSVQCSHGVKPTCRGGRAAQHVAGEAGPGDAIGGREVALRGRLQGHSELSRGVSERRVRYRRAGRDDDGSVRPFIWHDDDRGRPVMGRQPSTAIAYQPTCQTGWYYCRSRRTAIHAAALATLRPRSAFALRAEGWDSGALLPRRTGATDFAETPAPLLRFLRN
jgi:hypothetical protein